MDKDDSDLFSWVHSRVEEWRQYRDSNYKDKWLEYYRLWRGIWTESDKVRDTERSRLISPATQQAVESTVSELEEATFGRDLWFDIEDDARDPNKVDIPVLRKLLKEDLEKEKCKSALSEVLLNGAIYGTGIGEILMEEKDELVPDERELAAGVMARGVTSKRYVCVKLRPVTPFNFSIDPGVRDIDDALGCAIDDIVPRHKVEEGMDDGTYVDEDLDDYSQTYEIMMSGELRQVPANGKVKLTKYYGKVPANLIKAFHKEEEEKQADEEPQKKVRNNPYAILKKLPKVKEDAEEKDDEEDDEEDLVEAIVVIANDSIVIKAEYSPYMMQDRPVIAYQHDKIPDRFWGRGIPEKGYNAQKALDTELRARADALALTTHPMMAVDATRLPRGMKPKIQPGLTILTNGDPKTILMPFNFGSLNGVSYKESAELERMVTMATGAMDSAAPTMVNPRNNTSSGMSMMMGASIKRQKRTLANFQDQFLIPFIKKSAWRFMQFDPERYPVMDFKFVPASTMGIMAREYEMQQQIQMLSLLPPESKAFSIVLQQAYSLSSMPNREDIVAAIQELAAQKDEDPAAMAAAQAQMMQVQAVQEKNQMDAQVKQVELQLAVKASEREDQKLMLDAEKIKIDQGQLALKSQELMLKDKELELKDRELAATSALKELAIHVDANDKSEKNAIQSANNAQDNLTNRLNEMKAELNNKPTFTKVKVERDENGAIVGAILH